MIRLEECQYYLKKRKDQTRKDGQRSGFNETKASEERIRFKKRRHQDPKQRSKLDERTREDSHKKIGRGGE